MPTGQELALPRGLVPRRQDIYAERQHTTLTTWCNCTPRSTFRTRMGWCPGAKRYNVGAAPINAHNIVE
eukprot:2569292-Pyramimonas_sp.AAC.1